MLTKEQVKFYNESGYLIVQDIFTTEESKKYNQCIRRHANKNFAAIVNPDRFEDLCEQDERWKSDIVLEEIKETSDISRKVMTNTKVVSILETLQKREVVGLSSQMIFKEAFTQYCSQAWQPHQDASYPQDKQGAYLTSNWFLRGADIENGTIYVYPGTHKLGLLESIPYKSFRENPQDNPGSVCKIPNEYKSKKLDLIIPNNSIVFLHGYIIHGSYSNTSPRSRPWYSCCYISKGAEYFKGKNAKRKDILLK